LEELIVFLFISSTFLGSVLCVKENEHIAIENLIQAFPSIFQLILKLFIKIMIIILHIFLAHYSWKWITIVGSSLSSGFRIPVQYFYSILPVSAYLIIFYQIREIIELFFKKKSLSDLK